NYAAAHCPETYQGAVVRATQGAAYAMKARVALYFASLYTYDAAMRDADKAAYHYGIARDAAKACMDLNVYQLHADFGELFLNKTHNAEESVFCIPRSLALPRRRQQTAVPPGDEHHGQHPHRTGRHHFGVPDLGPLLRVPLHRRQAHRQIAALQPGRSVQGTRSAPGGEHRGVRHGFCGVVYDPRFDVEQVWDSNVGRNITNPDNIVTAGRSRLPSRTGLVQRKGIDKDWTDDYQADPDKIIICATPTCCSCMPRRRSS
ncbi:MAG: hypothetical protein V8Q54_10185, partial [Alistipes senegalensis]